MSNNLPVLSIAFVTGEEIQRAGLPTLKVYVCEDDYTLVEGQEIIQSALIKSLSHIGESNYTVVFLAVEVVNVRVRKTGGAA